MKHRQSDKATTATDSSTSQDPLSSSFADNVILSMIPKDDLIKLALRINEYLEKEYDVSKEELTTLSGNSVPVSIFSAKLSPLEALVKFLKEHRDLNYHKIGKAIGRDERGIWVTYRNATKKMSARFALPDNDLHVPMDIFVKELSILESLVRHLREQKEMKGSEIASILNKSTSTVWTVYNRAKDKGKE